MRISPDDLKGADEGVLSTILEQGEKRLESQCEFASAQDVRSGSLVAAASALAAVGAAAAAAGLGFPKPNYILAVAAGAAVVVFVLAAGTALLALRSGTFHGCGWYPHDFVDDLRKARPLKEIREDFILGLDHRLSETGERSLAAGPSPICKAASNRDPLSAPKRGPSGAVVCSRGAA